MLVAGGLLLTAYEVQGETMPGWLFSTIIIVGLVVLILGGAGFIIGRVIVPAIEHAKLWSIRMPLFRADTPDPNQWLLDIAKDHAENPAARILILKAQISNKNLQPEEYRPWVDIGLTIRNVGVHGIVIGGAEGHVLHNGRELPEAVQGEGGNSLKPPSHQHTYILRQYLPPEIAKELFEEMCGARRRVGSLGLSGVKIEVKSEDRERPHWLSLGSVDFIEVPD